MKASWNKYLLCCFSSLLLACGTNPVKTEVENKPDTFSDTLSTSVSPKEKKVVPIPNSMQQKAFDWYLKSRKGDSLHTIFNAHVVKFDSLRHKIYADTSFYPFADLSFMKAIAYRWMTVGSSQKAKPDSVLLKNNAVVLPSNGMILTAEKFLTEKDKFVFGDIHLTFSKAVFFEGNYYVQVWKLVNEEADFYCCAETFKFNKKGEWIGFMTGSNSPAAYSQTAFFLKTMKKTSFF